MAIRVAVLGIWAIIFFFSHYPDYALLPIEATEGFGVGKFLLSLPAVRALLFSAAVLSALKWGGCAACIIGIVWPHIRWPTAAAATIAFVLDQLTKALGGFANHAQTAPLFVLLVVAFTSKGLSAGRPMSPGALARDRTDLTRAHHTAVAVRWLVCLLLVLPYTYVGVNRLVRGGIELFTGSAITDYIALTSATHSAYGFTLGPEIVQVPAVAVITKLLFAGTTLMEMSAALILFSRRWRLAWLIAMTLFHVTTLVMMNIWFWENLLLLWVTFGRHLASRGPNLGGRLQRPESVDAGKRHAHLWSRAADGI